MNTKELYHAAIQKRHGSAVIVPMRKLSYFLTKPFFREIVGNYTKHFKTQEAAISKRFEKNAIELKELSDEHRSHFKDFDAVLERLNFIEQNLQRQDERILTVQESLSPVADLRLGGTLRCIELQKSNLSLHHGPYGDFLLRKPDIVGDSIRAGEFWDNHLHDLIIRHADKDGIAIDAGAYVGFHSVFLARYFSKVISFEPQGVVFQMLAANLVLNNVGNVEPHHAGLYDRHGWLKVASQEKQEVPLHLMDGLPDYAKISNAAAVTFEPADEGGYSVRSLPLDSLNLENVRFIKIDTQGADLRVLLGARETIRRWRPIIVFELELQLSKSHGSERSDYEDFFEDMDYNLHLLRSQEDKQFDFCATPR